MDTFFAQYVRHSAGAELPTYPAISEKRLLLIESDPVALRLIQEVKDSIPEVDTEEYLALNEEAHCGGLDSPPFKEKLGDLMEYVRRDLSESRDSPR